ncbi:MAG TPA: phosphotransferase [Candidatus Acidoferrum sp.]|nr:phosphotransferase [Candidatus Acidoferrum sp.]
MNIQNIETIPEILHDTARNAIAAAFGAAPVTVVAPVTGGASGAHAFRLEVAARDYVLRIEGKRNPLRNPHQYACMRRAAESGIAPAVLHTDEPNGVAIMDFVQQRPLAQYPGGPEALVTALGALAHKLQDTEPFPVVGDYRVFVERMLGRMQMSFAPGLIDPYLEAFARIRAVCPWDATAHVSSHNDPNPRNILFDGERLWLIDWETAYRNEALLDVAVLAENFAIVPELETVLLKSWLGTAPDAALRSRLVLMRLMTRLYYASLLSMMAATPQAPVQDLTAPTPEQFQAMLISGKVSATSADTLLMLAKMLLASFKTGMESAELKAAMATLE